MPAKTQTGALAEYAAQFAQALEAQQVTAGQELLAAWSDSYWAIRQDMDDLLDKVALAKANGTPMSPAWLAQQQRLKTLLATVKTQMAQYAYAAGTQTTKAQQAALAASLKHAAKMTQAAAAESLPGLAATFQDVNPAVLQAMAGTLADGSPLTLHLANTLPGQAVDGLRSTLLKGVGLGWGIDRMVREATASLAVPHTRAVTIMRTETQRAYRAASQATYLANSHVVGSWVWTAALDRRSCPACVVMHGTVHPLDARLDGHPRCRCAMVPRTRSWKDLGVDAPDTRPALPDGKAWLLAQPQAVQRAILGPSKYKALTEGAITLDDVVARTYHPVWGTTRGVRSLRAILDGENGNWMDAAVTPPKPLLPPPPPVQPNIVKAMVATQDLDALKAMKAEQYDTLGPQAKVNLDAAILYHLKRGEPLGPGLPTPDLAKVQKALAKLEQAVLTKGYPSKGYSQTAAVYKAHAAGEVGKPVGPLKALTWEQKITAQEVLARHAEALPLILRKARKAEAVEKAHAEALTINAQKTAEAKAKAIQAEATKAADAYREELKAALSGAGDHDTFGALMAARYVDLQDALDDALGDDLATAVATARLDEWFAMDEAYKAAREAIQANQWVGTTWQTPGGNLVLKVEPDGWGTLSSGASTLKVAPQSLQKTLTDPASVNMTQVLEPNPAEVQKWLDDVILDDDGFVSPKAYEKATESLGNPNSVLTPQQKADLQEALAQALATGKWKPDEAVLTTWKFDLDLKYATVDDALEFIATTDKPAWKAAVQAALKAHEDGLLAKQVQTPPPTFPTIDPAKIAWDKVSLKQVATLKAKVQSGEWDLGDLYAKFQASKNSGPKANYAHAILDLEGKGDTIPTVGAPSPAPAGAPTVAPPKPPPPAMPEVPPFKPDDLTFTGQVLGTHGARVYVGPDGTRWLFKPPKDRQDTFLATLDAAASRFQARAGLKAPDTFVVTLDGKRGSIQRMFEATDAFGSGFRPAALNAGDLAQVQRQHVLDWFLSNHDGHRDQFLRLPTGELVGIDKGQAFRWFGQDRLDWDFHPNQAYGAPEPVYNALWRAFARGEDVEVDLDAIQEAIRDVQAISDAEVRATFREYAEQAAARGLLAKRQQFPGLKAPAIPANDVEAFLDALVARKNGLEEEFRDLYERAAKERAKVIAGWKPAPWPKGGKPSPGTKAAKWAGKDKPTPPTKPEPPTPAPDLFDSWLAKAKAKYAEFSGGKNLEASNNWARFRRVVDDLDEDALRELLDRKYLSILEHQEGLSLIQKAKAQMALRQGEYDQAMADWQTAMDRHKADLADWKEANGVQDLTQGMDDDVVRHTNDDDGVRWAQRHFQEDRYTPTQRKWLRSYTGSSFSSWNDHLRQTEGRPSQYADAYRNIDKAMGAQPIPEDVILHRGIGYHSRTFRLGDEFLASGGSDDLTRLIGSVQVDHGYMSTSVGNSAAFSSQPVQLKIRAPAGTPGSYVQMFSQYQHERELILARGTRMYVHNAYKVNGTWFLEVEVVPEDFDPTNATPTPSAKPWSR